MPQLKTVKGTFDLLAKDINRFDYVKTIFKNICQNYGYQQIETPVFEDVKVFKRENDTSDMVNKEMYMIGDDKALRPEGTAGAIRAFVEHKLYVNEAPFKMFYMEKMYRHERPQKGRQREFTQIGVENLGDKKAIIDAEVIAMGYDVVKKLGLKDIKVLINTIGDVESRKKYCEVLTEYFKDKKECLCQDCQNRLTKNPLRILDCKIDNQQDVITKAPVLYDYLSNDSKNYFNEVLNYLNELNIEYSIDNRLVRGLDYYSETVFEVVSTNSASGAQSTLFAGGRYDELVEYFDGPSLSGVGFAMGLERLLILMDAEGIEIPYDESIDYYIIDLTNSNPYVLKVAQMLRTFNKKVELNFYDRKMKAQFKSVERKMAKNVVIIGDDEVLNETIVIKNIQTQEQMIVPLNKIKEMI